MTSLAGERGAALLVVLLTTTLVAGVATALIVQTSADVVLSASYRTGQEVFHAADAGLERTVAELAGVADWSPLLAVPPANQTASFSATGASFQTPDRQVLPLAGLLAARQAAGPGGFAADTPQWRVYAHATLAALWPPPADVPPAGLVIFVADDGLDGDGDAGADSNGRVLVHVDAYGLHRARRSVEGLVERVGPGVVRLAGWKEVR